MHVYQPMSGYRPTVVDIQAANFPHLDLSLRCVQGELLSRGETAGLCRKVATLFENQGARVAIASSGGFDDELDAPEAEPNPDSPLRAPLSVELRSRQVHTSKHPWSWVAFTLSFTLLPGLTESTFAQDIVIRHDSGFLLASETVQGRLVVRYGLGPWLGNTLMDLAREKEARLTGDAAERDVSNDLYRQLSQLVFDAEMRWRVLHETTN